MQLVRMSIALALVTIWSSTAQVQGTNAQPADTDSPVVRNQEADVAPILWNVEATPVVEIGGSETDPSEQLFQIVKAVRLDDGRILIATAGDYNLRFYDSQGGYLFAVGGEGEGPGEFRSFSSVQVGVHDSIYVYDQDLRRVTVFDTQGALERTIKVPAEQVPPSELERFRDNRWYAIDGDRIKRGASGTLQRDTAHFFSYTSSFDGRSLMVALPGIVTANAGAGGRIYRAAPFTPWPAYDEFGTCLYVTPGDAFEIRIVSNDGQPVRTIRNEGKKRSVSDEDVSEWTDYLIAEEGITNPKKRKVARKVARMLPHPEELPVYNDLVVDRDGYIWLQRYAPPAGLGRDWIVLNPAGELLGKVRMPAAVGVFDVGSNWMLTEWKDELKREYVRLYRLKRGESSAPSVPNQCTEGRSS